MKNNPESTSDRKNEHLDLCLNEDVSFRNKTNGFDRYDFRHYAATEVNIGNISFETDFLGCRINYPFLISCMTGGTPEAENINAQLAYAAEELKIPIGAGSQRQALEDKSQHNSFKVLRTNAPSVPILGNLGAAQIVRMKSFDQVQFLIDMLEGNALVIHLNPLQELMQKKGEPQFTGLLRKLEKLTRQINVPVIVKEVGAGISKEAAERLLSAGAAGIDVAGAGGTSWSGVEIIRSGQNGEEFWDWGLPTSYCIKEVYKLKKKKKFILIGSGGINTPFDMAKAFALGADITASARAILTELDDSGVEGVINLINGWFGTLKNIMFLTGSEDLKQFRNKKLIRKDKLF